MEKIKVSIGETEVNVNYLLLLFSLEIFPSIYSFLKSRIAIAWPPMILVFFLGSYFFIFCPSMKEKVSLAWNISTPWLSCDCLDLAPESKFLVVAGRLREVGEWMSTCSRFTIIRLSDLLCSCFNKVDLFRGLLTFLFAAGAEVAFLFNTLLSLSKDS